MTADLIVTIIAALAIAVGCVGIIVPILPGSMLIAIAALVWAIVVSGVTGWVTFAVVAVLVAVGMTASWFLTGKRLKARQVPNSSLLVAALVGVIGFFVIPVVGLLVGFVAGLYLMEWSRLKDTKEAWESSWAAIKAAGIGMIVEFSAALLAACAFTVGAIIHFVAQ